MVSDSYARHSPNRNKDSGPSAMYSYELNPSLLASQNGTGRSAEKTARGELPVLKRPLWISSAAWSVYSRLQRRGENPMYFVNDDTVACIRPRALNDTAKHAAHATDGATKFPPPNVRLR